MCVPGLERARRRATILAAAATLGVLAAPAADGALSRTAVPGPRSCATRAYSYAGVQASSTAHGVAATLVATSAPRVDGGHVGGWIGVGGTDAGPGGAAEWLQTGLAAFPGNRTLELYYEVTLPGSQPRYVELEPAVAAGERHRFAVIEMGHRPSWWRVWLDGAPVSPPIHLPRSDGTWYPQAVSENWNGGEGACNGYSYLFSDLRLALGIGGAGWTPLQVGYTFDDPGYRVGWISSAPRSFLAASVGA